jgi:membrane-associated protein
VNTALNLLNATALSDAGLFVVLAILFAETGLLVGFFLPGDSLLVAAGIAAANHKLSLAGLLVGAPLAAIIGGQVGYQLGRAGGPRLFARPDSRFFRNEYVDRARHHLDRFGNAKAIVLARFVPIVRTMLNPVAGAIRMPLRTFIPWNIVSGLVWAVGVTLAGYQLGKSVKGIDRFLLPLIALIVLVSVVPIVLEVRRSRAASGGRT